MVLFAPGQRWLSTAEPELGLGAVLRVDGRTIQVLFAKSGVIRLFAAQSAPLIRASFRPSDRIIAHENTFRVDEVEVIDGLFHYRCGDDLISEGELDDVQGLSNANERLISARVDRNDLFALRIEALQRRAQARRSPAFGLESARVGLIPHQLKVAQIAANRRSPRILLADEVGLGKTIEAGLILSRLIAAGRASRVLILVPEALVYQWFVELLRRFNLSFAIFDEERVEAIESAGDGRNPFEDEQLVITDTKFLAGAPSRAQMVNDAGWDLLIVDEAHHLAWSPSEQSAEYTLVEALAQKTAGVVLLTATPEQLGRSGHFARLRLLDPSRYHDLAEFEKETEQYVALSEIANLLTESQALSKTQTQLLSKLLQQDAAVISACEPSQIIGDLIDRHGTGRVMFRNRRAVVGGFPQRIAHLVTLPADQAPEGFAAHLMEEFLVDVANRQISTAYSYLDDPRLVWLCALLDSHPTEKFLLICRSQEKVHALEEALRVKSGVAVARFHEGLGIVQRDRNAAFFASPEGARLLLCSELGSEGRNFQFASHLVLWDVPLDPDQLEQRIGRLDRIGQQGDVNIHVATLEASAQAAVVRWYDQALNSFRCAPEDGRQLLKLFGESLVQLAIAQAQGMPEAEAAIDQLIESSQSVHVELAEVILKGRDHLLELATQRAASEEVLRQALESSDADEEADEFIIRLFESFGVSVDEHEPRTMVLDPEMLSTEAFVGLEGGPRSATFSRDVALTNEDKLFLRLDHPMVSSAMDLLLDAETGNAAFLIDDTLAPRTTLLETIFVVECVADIKLDASRFMPPVPVRVVVDNRRSERPDYIPNPRVLHRADDRAVDLSRFRKLLATLVPPLLSNAEDLLKNKIDELVAEACTHMEKLLGDEIDRLSALAKVNSSIRPQEIAAITAERDALRIALPQSRPRLDSVRFIASPDLLNLRV